MATILVLRHVPHEDAGLLGEVLAAAGHRLEYLDLFADPPREAPLAQAAALVVLGGPMNVDQHDRYPFLAWEIGWIRQALDAPLPVLGICLGAQLLAAALGAPVYPAGEKEIGWYRVARTDAAAGDPLLGHWRRQETVFQWHGCTFDLPAGAVRLAGSDACPNQAFRYGRAAYGLQFHIEVTAAMVDAWLDVRENRAELRELPQIDPQAIRRAAADLLPPMHALARETFARWAALLEP